MELFEALYGRNCRTPFCWSELDEKRIIVPDFVLKKKEKVKLICKRLKVASDRQKSYIYLKCHDIEFQVRYKVFLKVSPWKKVQSFRLKELERNYDVFHVSMLQNYLSDTSHIVPVEEIKVRPDLTYDEELVEILAQEEKVL
ncbi:uncharacterized protein LOC128036151 [Gossypium raimondii]|uniref:uncharacterized protein LOC128036151 n=1 Tax=Gossypium raimondii TaxID=29730 RepID=UPI00227ADC0C|nr:uncharacterized protein LOC128036151 [Gossypium raimondii]